VVTDLPEDPAAARTARAVRRALEAVRDPEIPVCSVVDLGLVERVTVSADAVEVTLLPTFLGCPALDVIRADVERAVRGAAPGLAVRVRYALSPPWTTDRITPAGREALRSFGIAPPGRRGDPVPCPTCGARETRPDADFGPTPCRAIRTCPSCRTPFEAFKPKLEEGGDPGRGGAARPAWLTGGAGTGGR
jgi:ring-1,2-phenylacetyl-CoA epoxidase subunit PaaD